MSQPVQVDQLNEAKLLYDLQQNNSVSRIARLADGDARIAITALRVAARKTTQDGLPTIPTGIVEESILAAGQEVR